jgi:hypothetical protein
MKRWIIIIVGVLLVLAVGTFVGFRLAVNMLKDKVVAALGPGSEIRGSSKARGATGGRRFSAVRPKPVEILLRISFSTASIS